MFATMEQFQRPSCVSGLAATLWNLTLTLLHATPPSNSVASERSVMPNILESSEEEQIRIFAGLLELHDQALLSNLDKQIGPGAGLLYGLELPEVGRKEFAELYQAVFLPNGIDQGCADRIPATVRVFVDRIASEVVQLHVFECVFALIRHAIEQVPEWSDPLIADWEQTIMHVAKISDGNSWKTDDGTLCVNWTGDMTFIPFAIPTNT